MPKLTKEYLSKTSGVSEDRWKDFVQAKDDLNRACCDVNDAKDALEQAKSNERGARERFEKAKVALAGELEGPVSDGYGTFLAPDEAALKLRNETWRNQTEVTRG